MEINDIPKEPVIRREWIKYQLKIRGYTLAKLSYLFSNNRKSVTQALRVPVPKWERVIARILGLRPQDLWPERYDEAGRPNRNSSRYPRNDTTNNSRRQRMTTGRK